MPADSRYAVLIAEDYSEFRAKLLTILEPLDLECIPVANGRQAIEVVRDLSRVLHLVVTDMDMPVHTGWEVIAATREHRGPELPIIMQTGEARYSYVQRRAGEFGVPLIDKVDVATHLIPAVRAALMLAPDAAPGGSRPLARS
jgi:CheY-like chemotaxis protein